MTTFNAILFPADDRPPQEVLLMTTPLSAPEDPSNVPLRCGRVPHPELYMDYIANQFGRNAWSYHLIEALDGMLQNLPMPYIVFYPVVSRDGMSFPVNKCIREIQGERFDEKRAWRGNLVIAKYRDADFAVMTDASMAEFPIIKNFLSTHHPR